MDNLDFDNPKDVVGGGGGDDGAQELYTPAENFDEPFKNLDMDIPDDLPQQLPAKKYLLIPNDIGDPVEAPLEIEQMCKNLPLKKTLQDEANVV